MWRWRLEGRWQRAETAFLILFLSSTNTIRLNLPFLFPFLTYRPSSFPHLKKLNKTSRGKANMGSENYHKQWRFPHFFFFISQRRYKIKPSLCAPFTLFLFILRELFNRYKHIKQFHQFSWHLKSWVFKFSSYQVADIHKSIKLDGYLFQTDKFLLLGARRRHLPNISSQTRWQSEYRFLQPTSACSHVCFKDRP